VIDLTPCSNQAEILAELTSVYLLVLVVAHKESFSSQGRGRGCPLSTNLTYHMGCYNALWTFLWFVWVDIHYVSCGSNTLVCCPCVCRAAESVRKGTARW